MVGEGMTKVITIHPEHLSTSIRVPISQQCIHHLVGSISWGFSLKTTNVNLMVELVETSGITPTSPGNNPSDGCWSIKSGPKWWSSWHPHPLSPLIAWLKARQLKHISVCAVCWSSVLVSRCHFSFDGPQSQLVSMCPADSIAHSNGKNRDDQFQISS